MTSSAADLPGWTLDVADDFTSIDTTRWTVRDDDYNDYEASYLTARNCTIEPGGAEDGNVLRLQGKLENAVASWGKTFKYTSCQMTSKGKYTVDNYFRAEIRAKLPQQQGLWAAPMWFRPEDGTGGEIDPVEVIGKERATAQNHQTIHTAYDAHHQQVEIATLFSQLGDPAGTGWHTYTIEKVPGSVSMSVDGMETAHWGTGNPTWYDTYYEASKRWNLRVYLQIGGSWGGLPDSTTDWSPDSSAVFVDHIYTWKYTPVPPTTPTAPTGLQAALVGGVPSLTWTAATDDVGVTGYEVYRNGTLLATTTATDTYYVDASAPQGTFSYTVVAVDADDNHSRPSSAATITVPDTVAPTAPGLLTVTTSGTAAALSWTAATDNVGVTGYRIFRDGLVVATTAGLSWSDTAVRQGSSYAYTVKALDAAGNVSDAGNIVVATIPDTVAPSVPSRPTAKVVDGVPVLTWKPSKDNVGVAGYDVLRDGVVVGTSGTTSYTDSGAPQGATYRYTVRAWDAAGNVSASSAAESLNLRDSTPPSAPAWIQATRTGTTAVVSWGTATDNVGVTNYLVYRGTTLVATVDASTRSCTVSGLSTSSSYTLKVVARDRAGNKGPAVSVTV